MQPVPDDLFGEEKKDIRKEDNQKLPLDDEARDLLNALQFMLCIRHASDIKKCTKYQNRQKESQKES